MKRQDKTSVKSNHFVLFTTAHIAIELHQFLISNFSVFARTDKHATRRR